MPVSINTPIDSPLWRQRVTLDGREFIFDFDYTEREDRYYLSIYLVDETPLVRGIKVVANWPLTRRSADRRMFPGELIAETNLNNSNLGDPGYGELGLSQRCTLLYYTGSEFGGLYDDNFRIGISTVRSNEEEVDDIPEDP